MQGMEGMEGLQQLTEYSSVANQVLTARFGRVVQRDPAWIRGGLIVISSAFLFVLVLLPLALVFEQALARGIGSYWRAITEPNAVAAIRLTLMVSLSAVLVNLAFG